ncbi:MAG: hypothetical protein Q9170_000747 [Blastenia crenularia]
MPPRPDESNPIAGPGDYLTDPVHNDTYAAIDPLAADLSGKSVFISGASKGLGRAMALSFASAGASSIAIGARGDMTSLVGEIKARASAAKRPPLKVLPIKFDVTSQESIDDAAVVVGKEVGKLDILINNAGVLSAMSNVADSDPEDWWRAWTVNVRGTYLVTRAFLPLMLKADGEKTDCQLFIETPELSADAIVYLVNEKRAWLAGRYINCTWDMPQIMAMKDDIVKGDKLKVRLVI